MRITSKFEVVARNDGSVMTKINGTSIIEDGERKEVALKLYKATKGKSDTEKARIFNVFKEEGELNCFEELNGNEGSISAEERLEDGLSQLLDFFTEFNFEPNFRFVNTLSYKVNDSLTGAKEYIANYFSLMDNPYSEEVKEKMKSAEFNNILKDIAEYGKPTSRINNRFKIYYGSAGTGKTTLAQKESNGRCIVCNNSMLPSDIMEDFVFENGQPSFKPSILWESMENGNKIVLDEINLLPFDSLRFLQGVLDGKKSFEYKGRTVNIADGFEVIGTMNLSIGGSVYGLPEPLVDRCGDMKEFKLSAKQLMKAITE